MQKSEPYNLEEIEEPKSKKVIIMILAIFLIILILSWGIIRYPINTIIEGQLKAESIKENQIILKELTILFENNTQTILSQIYNTEQEGKLVETSVCLLGNKYGNEYHIKSIFYPEITEQTFRHVSFKSCPQNTLIMLHTHPFKHCLASETDITTLETVKKYNQDIVMIVMCEENKYSIYT